jgi:hypothetical protein
MSITVLPADRPAMPSGLTARPASGVSGTMMMTISAFSATAFRLSSTVRRRGSRAAVRLP